MQGGPPQTSDAPSEKQANGLPDLLDDFTQRKLSGDQHQEAPQEGRIVGGIRGCSGRAQSTHAHFHTLHKHLPHPSPILHHVVPIQNAASSRPFLVAPFPERTPFLPNPSRHFLMPTPTLTPHSSTCFCGNPFLTVQLSSMTEDHTCIWRLGLPPKREFVPSPHRICTPP